jgi:iron only hydrogenase large subunit-like protein
VLLPGCLNGGGQIRLEKGTIQAQKDLTKALDQLYHSRTVREPSDNPVVQRLYKEGFGSPYSETARKLLHTQYHAVEKMEISNPLAAKW